MTGNEPPLSAQRPGHPRTNTPSELTSLTAEEGAVGSHPMVVMISDWTLCTQTSLRVRLSLFDWLRNALKRFRLGS